VNKILSNKRENALHDIHNIVFPKVSKKSNNYPKHGGTPPSGVLFISENI